MFQQTQKFKRKNSEIVSVIFVAKNLASHLDFYVKAQCVRLWLLSSIFHLAEEWVGKKEISIKRLLWVSIFCHRILKAINIRLACMKCPLGVVIGIQYPKIKELFTWGIIFIFCSFELHLSEAGFTEKIRRAYKMIHLTTSYE